MNLSRAHAAEAGPRACAVRPSAMRHPALITLASLLGGSLAAAAPAKPAPRDRLAALGWLLGAWRCEGKAGAEPWAFQVVFTSSLQGAWIDGHMTMQTPAGPFELTATMGYSTRDGGWVRWDRSSTGSTKLLTSEGPGGDAIAFSSPPAEGGFRELLRHTGAGFAGRIETFEGGRWIESATFSCRRAP